MTNIDKELGLVYPSDLCRVKFKYFLKICHKLITRARHKYIVKPGLNSTQIYDTIMDYASQHRDVSYEGLPSLLSSFVLEKYHIGHDLKVLYISS